MEFIWIYRGKREELHGGLFLIVQLFLWVFSLLISDDKHVKISPIAWESQVIALSKLIFWP